MKTDQANEVETARQEGATAVAVGSTDWLGERLRASLGRMTPEQRAKAYVNLNTYKWPESMADLKPGQWENLTCEQRYRSEESRELWKALHEMTSEYERSRAWWLDELDRTTEEHLEWWLTQRRRSPNGGSEPPREL